MTDNRMAMRVSDRDRQQAVDRLRAGLEDGRLKMEEYVERMGLAYQAVTYADLAPLDADLPAAGSPRPQVPAAAPRAVAPGGGGGLLCGLPTVLRVLWTIWLTAVSINVVIWALVSATSGHLAYPWPLWVAGPYGALLVAVSVSVTQSRHARRPAIRLVRAAAARTAPLGVAGGVVHHAQGERQADDGHDDDEDEVGTGSGHGGASF
jgi:hypothetical protein